MNIRLKSLYKLLDKALANKNHAEVALLTQLIIKEEKKEWLN